MEKETQVTNLDRGILSMFCFSSIRYRTRRIFCQSSSLLSQVKVEWV